MSQRPSVCSQQLGFSTLSGGSLLFPRSHKPQKWGRNTEEPESKDMPKLVLKDEKCEVRASWNPNGGVRVKQEDKEKKRAKARLKEPAVELPAEPGECPEIKEAWGEMKEMPGPA